MKKNPEVTDTHDDYERTCRQCDEFCCTFELCPCCVKALNGYHELRALITAWADAYDRVEDEWALGDGSELVAYYAALNALREAVGR